MVTTGYQVRKQVVTSVDEISGDLCEEEIIDDPLYLLQVIEIDGKQYNLFYDSGCGGAIISKSARDRLGRNRVQQLTAGEIEIGGVGGITTRADGECKFKLPLASGKEALLVGPCMEQITHTFPTFPLQSILEEVRKEARKTGSNSNDWPQVHPFCGGDTDIMLGIRYKQYHPEEVFSLPSGLGVFM